MPVYELLHKHTYYFDGEVVIIEFSELHRDKHYGFCVVQAVNNF